MAVFCRGLAPLARPLVRPFVGAFALALSLVSTVVLAVSGRFASADPPAMCRVVNVDFTPGGIPAGGRKDPRKAADDPDNPLIASPEIDPQIVAWLEKPSGEFVQTIYITQQTGRYGLGNRPGRFDFNSGPNWPYGRRTTVFPVWAHRNKQTFMQVEFQNGDDNALSHTSGQSSREAHFCRPLSIDEHPQWDAASCASTVYTDKGVFGSASSSYPPRSDIVPVTGTDSPSVAMYKTMNPFDAVSQATPHLGTAAQISWPIPPELAPGPYVLFLEVALEQDFNATYSGTRYPSPNVAYGTYGVPYRGQPSVVYQVAFTLADTATTMTADNYVGYGDPDGGATLHPPDDTISDTPNSGAQRLLMTSKDGQTFRVRVDAHPERDVVAPAPPGDMVVSAPLASSATLSFLAPGDDGLVGTVTGYEVRYQVGDTPITDANFASANEVTFDADLVSAGQSQTLTVKNLLPETQYTVGVRAFDNCHNTSAITTVAFTTAARKIGEVDACFIATAAYGSVLANDVDMLRRFRDMLLKRSVLGELAVETYYTFGPPVAGVVGESDLLRSTARDFLSPIVDRVRGLRW